MNGQKRMLLAFLAFLMVILSLTFSSVVSAAEIIGSMSAEIRSCNGAGCNPSNPPNPDNFHEVYRESYTDHLGNVLTRVAYCRMTAPAFTGIAQPNYFYRFDITNYSSDAGMFSGGQCRYVAEPPPPPCPDNNSYAGFFANSSSTCSNGCQLKTDGVLGFDSETNTWGPFLYTGHVCDQDDTTLPPGENGNGNGGGENGNGNGGGENGNGNGGGENGNGNGGGENGNGNGGGENGNGNGGGENGNGNGGGENGNGNGNGGGSGPGGGGCTGDNCGDGDGDGSASGGQTCESAPECDGDPIACAQLNQMWLNRCGLSDSDINEVFDGEFQNAVDGLDHLVQEYTDDLQELFDNDLPFASALDESSTSLQGILPTASSCQPFTLSILDTSHTMECDHFNTFKLAFGWFLSILTVGYIWHMAVQPVNR